MYLLSGKMEKRIQKYFLVFLLIELWSDIEELPSKQGLEINLHIVEMADENIQEDR